MENRYKSKSFYSTRSGVNTTFKQPGQQYDSLKSKIENLPSHRKTNLAGKLEFVVVFQTIEIERLSIEVQSLRVMLKDAERQIRNYRNYEVQIKQLTENCHQLQQQRSVYHNQIEQISLACNSLYEQLNQSKKQYQRQIDQLKAEFLRRNEDMNDRNQAASSKISELEQKIKGICWNEKDLQVKLKQRMQQQQKLNNNINKLMNELIILRQQQQYKNKQLNNIKQQIEYIKQQNNKQLNNIKIDNNLIINKFKQQNKQLYNKYKQKQKIIQQINNKLEQNISSYNNHIQQSNHILQDNHILKQKYDTIMNQYQSIIKQLHKYQKINQELINNLQNIKYNVKKQKQNSQRLNTSINNLQNNIQYKCKEIQSIKNYLGEYQHQWKIKSQRQNDLLQKLQSLESIITQNNNLHSQLSHLDGIISQKQNIINNKDKIIRQIDIQRNQLLNTYKLMQDNFFKNQQIINQLQDKLISNNQKNQNQKRKIKNQYQKILQKQLQQKKQLIYSFNNLQKQYQKIKAQGLIRQDLKIQINKLKQDCRKQTKQFQSFKDKIQALSSIIKKLKQKITKFRDFEKTNTIIKQQLELSFALNQRMMKKIQQYELQITILTDQNSKISEKLREDSWKDDFSTSSSSNATFSTVNTTPLATSLRFSSVEQVRPFQFSKVQNKLAKMSPSKFIISNYGASNERAYNGDVSWASKSPSKFGNNFDSKRNLEQSSFYPSRDTNYSLGVYSSMISQFNTSKDSIYGQRRDWK